MVRLRLAVIECNYKEIDRQLKEQFIHGLNDTDMLAEIIIEFNKIEENAGVTSEKVLYWAKRVEAKRAQSTIMNGLTETKEFEKLKIMNAINKDSPGRPFIHIKIPAKHKSRYCGSSHPLR